jgi:uncharacterized membrane protein YvlD (DUF360 family)
MMIPLFIMTFSLFFFFISILLLRIRGEIIQRKIEVLKFNQVK